MHKNKWECGHGIVYRGCDAQFALRRASVRTVDSSLRRPLGKLILAAATNVIIFSAHRVVQSNGGTTLMTSSQESPN